MRILAIVLDLEKYVPELLADLRLAQEVAQPGEDGVGLPHGDLRGYLYDVVDSEDGTDDASCRPNQLFAISLEHAVLEPVRRESVLRVVQDRLVTPFGLRSLAPGHADYKSRYFGNLRSRDGAYHQGTVWAWLIGPFVDAYLKVHPTDVNGARRLLEAFDQALSEFGVGSIGEIFDGDEPFNPRGCIAQAWSVAEVLRCWVAVTGNPSRPHSG